jgi:hypothetical protein
MTTPAEMESLEELRWPIHIRLELLRSTLERARVGLRVRARRFESHSCTQNINTRESRSIAIAIQTWTARAGPGLLRLVLGAHARARNLKLARIGRCSSMRGRARPAARGQKS